MLGIIAGGCWYPGFREILRMFSKIQPQVYTLELIKSAFKATGLLPFNLK